MHPYSKHILSKDSKSERTVPKPQQQNLFAEYTVILPEWRAVDSKIYLFEGGEIISHTIKPKDTTVLINGAPISKQIKFNDTIIIHRSVSSNTSKGLLELNLKIGTDIKQISLLFNFIYEAQFHFLQDRGVVTKSFIPENVDVWFHSVEQKTVNNLSLKKDDKIHFISKSNPNKSISLVIKCPVVS